MKLSQAISQNAHRISARDSSTISLLRHAASDFEVYLVGTAHVSSKSERSVRETIRAVKPVVVMVELCEDRARHLRATPKGAKSTHMFDDPFLQQVNDVWAQLTSANGQDMVAAMEEAESLQARVLCGDAPQAQTASAVKKCIADMGGSMQVFSRVMQAPPPPPELERSMNHLGAEIMKAMGSSGSSLFGSLGGFGGPAAQGGGNLVAKKTLSDAVSKAIEHFKDRKRLRELRAWLGQVSPELIGAMLDRRDEHMYRELTGLAGAIGQVKGPGLRGVAVVGLAHMDGIEERWRNDFGPSSVQSIDKTE